MDGSAVSSVSLESDLLSLPLDLGVPWFWNPPTDVYYLNRAEAGEAESWEKSQMEWEQDKIL